MVALLGTGVVVGQANYSVGGGSVSIGCISFSFNA